MGHPYRIAGKRPPPPDEARPPFDVEEWVTLGLVGVVGILGVVVGVVRTRSTELAIGGLLLGYALRIVWREAIVPWRSKR